MSNNKNKRTGTTAINDFLSNLPAGMRGLTAEANSDLKKETKEIVPEKVETKSETKSLKTDKQIVEKGEFDDVLGLFTGRAKGQHSTIYVHPELRELCLKIKTIPRYSKVDIKNIASAMIYGYFMEHKEEFLKMFEEANNIGFLD